MLTRAAESAERRKLKGTRVQRLRGEDTPATTMVRDKRWRRCCRAGAVQGAEDLALFNVLLDAANDRFLLEKPKETAEK